FGFYTPIAGRAASCQLSADHMANCQLPGACRQPPSQRLPTHPLPPPSQPAGRGQRTSHGGPVHPCWMGKLPN
ncbi:hypothetical protein DSO57_1032297, partial [Entomophthora muscae]